ncbi:NAD(P)-dependent oxidoreductase [Corynebacterium riegelii]|uniref:NAD(P)-dependent oxidoreductase n=1 Tax=Corynebacterium riegelii TaxID=156976 RepID=UPI0030B898A9
MRVDLMHVGIIGLGKMGFSMAQNLLDKGQHVTGFDISSEARKLAQESGVPVAENLEALVKAQPDWVVLSLPKAEHVEEVCLGPASLRSLGLQANAVIDMSTSVPEASRRVASGLQDINVAFADAPVSGGPSGAREGTMISLVGCAEDTYRDLTPLLDIMTSRHMWLGDVGSGNVAKLCNNLLVGLNLIAVSEAVNIATSEGLSPEALIQALNLGSGRSAVSEINFPRWILDQSYDSGFTAGLMRKDLQLVEELVGQGVADHPLSKLALSIWHESQNDLPDQRDFNEIVRTTAGSPFSEIEPN